MRAPNVTDSQHLPCRRKGRNCHAGPGTRHRGA